MKDGKEKVKKQPASFEVAVEDKLVRVDEVPGDGLVCLVLTKVTVPGENPAAPDYSVDDAMSVTPNVARALAALFAAHGLIQATVCPELSPTPRSPRGGA